ncbi:hypothetical protein IU459_36120 [Nocardia amamiensis]|uniref:IrrE N-terminal-like domain-containing protein n=1 Tax=Nocardia amamiensis TaxID=404578 RepID=A0ABS0D233_9NOCA|nr:hypothetical protein [Nocardia amamiensis]MBF6302905.1 hypothetical protein [Nocardia amamiensis]
MNLDQCVARLLDLLTPEVQQRFAEEPLLALREDLKLNVAPIEYPPDTRRQGGACDGTSFIEDGVILYVSTPYNRRENFTLGHELGHWLIPQSDEVMEWIVEQDHAEQLVETVCDRVAQRLLLPPASIASVVGRPPVRAAHIIELFDRTQASRPVCAIAIATRLPHVGAVALIDRAEGKVLFASVRPDPEEGWPLVVPWKGQLLPAGHRLASLNAGVSVTGKMFWKDQWDRRAEYYVDAVSDHRRITAVFSDIDLWDCESLHLDGTRDFDQRPTATIHCCGSTRTVRGYPCPECNEQFCPECGRCRCQRRAAREQACHGCLLRFQAHLVVGGLCEECRS